MKITEFLRENPVFTRKHFNMALSGDQTSENTLKNKLAYHLKQGHIVRVKRGLFAAIPYGARLESYPINPYLVASRLTDDAVLAYQTALAFYGFSYSTIQRFIYLTATKSKPMIFRDNHYQPSRFPDALVQHDKADYLIRIVDIQGCDVRITSKERTLVDVFDRPLLGGGWEEIWRSLEMIDWLDVSDIVSYALQLGNALTIARVGFYLERRRTDFNVTNEQLSELKLHIPKAPQYMDRRIKGKAQLNADWNILVPNMLLNNEWYEDLRWEPKT